MISPVERFSDRVAAYKESRPRYPVECLEVLRREAGLEKSWTVADIGSGTGIFTRLLVEHGNAVYAVEPNEPMRRAAEEDLASFPGFVSVDGSAEATTLSSGSIDLVVCAQAFHWFDRARARDEFLRILRGRKPVVLLWNERRLDTPVLRDYERLIHGVSTEYASVDHRRMTARDFDVFFGSVEWKTTMLPNSQRLDWDGLKRRAESVSYMPAPGSEAHPAMIEQLRRLFDAHAKDGSVVFDYDLNIYSGFLT